MSKRCGRKKDARVVIYTFPFGPPFPLCPLFFPICTCPSSARPPVHNQYSASSASPPPSSLPVPMSPRPSRPAERARNASQNRVPSGIGSVRDVDAGTYVMLCVSLPQRSRRWLSDFLTNWPQTGEMMSDLPAMHNSAFNSKSFALRGELQMLSHMLPVCSADISPGMTSPTFVKPFTDRIIINFAILSELPDEPNVDYEHVGQLPAR